MLEYTRSDVERKFPYCDYEVYPESAWNYGFFRNPQFNVREKPIAGKPFSGEEPPMEIEAQMVPIDWPEEYGVAAMEPRNRIALDVPRSVRMIPYGCARLRMTEMPVIE